MSYGYSSRLIKLNQHADKKHLGVILGRKCIKADIPVSQVANLLGVSRMTVYNWFTGLHIPQPACVDAIDRFLESFDLK